MKPHAVEMTDILRRTLQQSVWIPLLAREERDYSHPHQPGSVSTYEGAVTLAFPLDMKADAMTVEWRDVGCHSGHEPHVEDGEFTGAECFIDYRTDAVGLRLVFHQVTNLVDGPRVVIHPDLILGLGLIEQCTPQGREWVAPAEGYAAVIRVSNDTDGHPTRVEMRAEHLRDFLCARKMGLAVYSYRSRAEVMADEPQTGWPEIPYEKSGEYYDWVGSVTAIDQSGMPYDQETRFMHVVRTDVDPDPDVPELSFPSPGATESRTRSIRPTGPRYYRLSGELWRTEWLDPASCSPRIAGDPWPDEPNFIIGAAGETAGNKDLIESGKWLWFRPDVIKALLAYRNSSITWFTRDTGRVSGGPQCGVVFGVNDLGLVNLYAKDVALLSHWLRREWRAHNVAPDGGVSKELLATQAVGQPADTQAPEAFLQNAIDRIQPLSRAALGFELFRQHQSTPEILSRCHRFRATTAAGLLELAKDVARVTVDDMDVRAMNRHLGSPDPALGSLKAIERILLEHFDAKNVQVVCETLFGIYELRLADAHLPRADLVLSLKKVGIDDSRSYVLQGRDLLDACVSALWMLGDALEKLVTSRR